jgi:hypothetical protein
MSSKKRALSEEEIDGIVTAHADDESAWEEPVRVRPPKSMSLELPSELVVRAARCARVARAASVGEWIRRVVRERVELEEAASARPRRSGESGGRAEKVSPARQERERRAGAARAKSAGYSKRRA